MPRPGVSQGKQVGDGVRVVGRMKGMETRGKRGDGK